MLPAPARALLDTFATGAALAFLVLIAWPAYDYALEEVPITHAGAADYAMPGAPRRCPPGPC